MVSALELVDDAIADLQARLNIDPNAPQQAKAGNNKKGGSSNNKKEKKSKQQPQPSSKQQQNVDQPDICKLEFKVGVIAKCWLHPEADKLYCEEIDVGEGEPRQIASGLRPHFTLEQMQGQRLLVVANLKKKNLLGFKSHGMVLCAAAQREDGSELVEFVEPPEGAPIGEVVTFEGLPPPEPWSAAQVDKRKVFQACAEGMKTTDDCVATWNGHVFMTSAGPCKAKTVAGGEMR
jgi:aminoacyl tRNA synthase complex-interacting multifunctional protein 1